MYEAHKSIFANSDEQFASLQERIEGRVIHPSHPDYDRVRQGWNLTYTHYPAVVVLPHSAHDVVEAIRYAHEVGLEFGVQATGHGFIRPADGRMLIVTAEMNAVSVDTLNQTAWVEAGVEWDTVLQQTQDYGLAPLLGSSPNVGAVGYTLGGGMGWLARKYGLSADNVDLFELVTYDGRLIHASATENPDLFWALRGGGGGFGVITGMQIRLFPVTTVYGGSLFYPVEQAREVFARFREWITQVPDELTSSITVMNFPPFPEVPEPLRGKTAIVLASCFVGPVEEGEALARFWRDWQPPMIDALHTMSFRDVATISNDPVPPMAGKSTGVWMDRLTDEAIDAILKHAIARGPMHPIVVTTIRHAGGAIARIDPTETAYSNRDANLLVQMIGVTPSPEAMAGFEAATQAFKDELKPALTGTVYMNFLEGEESRQRTRDAFTAEKMSRLQAIKAQYDPEYRFNLGFDIRPTVR